MARVSITWISSPTTSCFATRTIASSLSISVCPSSTLEGTFEGTTTTPVGISHGYSPAEQYRKNGVQSFSPQSDVYALAATLYKLLTGVTPPEAMEIQDEGLPLEPLRDRRVSGSVVSAIVNAMKPKSQRTQSVEAFVSELGGDSSGATVVEVEAKLEPATNKETAPNPQPRREAEQDSNTVPISQPRPKRPRRACSLELFHLPAKKHKRTRSKKHLLTSHACVGQKRGL